MATRQLHETDLNGYHHAKGTKPSHQSPVLFPPPHDNDLLPSTNGMARTTSKRRRQSGSGIPVRTPKEIISQPPAPEVPRAPPVSYRPPYSIDNPASQKPNSPSPSFAERAQSLTGKPLPIQSFESTTEAVERNSKPVRRGSLNRPIGGVYSEIQQHRRDSYPPNKDVAPLQRISNSSSLPQRQAPIPQPSSREAVVASDYRVDSTSPSSPIVPQVETRIGLAGATQTFQKEWAPDRSPLQKLEVKLSDISKEEKRARVQEAEQRLRDFNTSVKQRSSSKQDNQVIDGDITKRNMRKVKESRPGRFRNQPEPVQNLRQFQSKYDEGAGSPATISTESSHMPVSDTPSEPNYIEQTPHKMSEKGTMQAYQVLNRNRSGRNSAKKAGTTGIDLPSGREVRFQGPDSIDNGYENASRTKNGDLLGDRRRLDSGSSTRTIQARGDPENYVRQRPLDIVNAPDPMRISRKQQELHRTTADLSWDSPSVTNFGKAADPLPRHGVGQPSRYDSPPSGAQGRQALSSFTARQPAIDAPAPKKHHLLSLLHRDHDHFSKDQSITPKSLDEWRRAGTARLTAADFQTTNTSEEDQHAWWEGHRSGTRSKTTRNKARDVETSRGSYPSNHGKSIVSSSHQADSDEGRRFEAPAAPEVGTRAYLTDYEIEKLRTTSKPLTRTHLVQFLRRSDHDHALSLSSTYSYSCPNLALHNPAHRSHICEPYLSSELTQSMRSIRIRIAPDLATFSPPLYLKCGPLLRYTGMKRDRQERKARSGCQSSITRETWRGSVMIVTADADSSYDPVPTLNLFHEPMDILPPPSHQEGKDGNQELSSEFVDPIAGLPKLSRSGKTIYVKPVDDLEHAKDLSQLETDDGLFEETRTAAVPTAYGTPDFHVSSGNPKAVRREGRASKKGHQVKGIKLHAERGVTFWRFNIEVELGTEQTRIAYSINKSPSVGFWVPAQGQTMNIMFHSCNGFSMSVRPDDYAGPDPMWRDVLNSHQSQPFHVMIGGGDQIYNDAVMSQSPLFQEWLNLKNPHHKHEADFTPALEEELETFYLERYSMWFSQGLFGMANSQIPMVNMWDDHDIIDGFGSYPDHFMSTPVFCGLGAVAFKYYMLFQHQSIPDETSADEPSWVMGAAPGPYINDLSRSIFMSLGKNVALLAVDCRTERMREEVLSEASYDLLFVRCRREILEGETRHLIVLLGIPIAYPRLVWLENVLTSKVMDPVKYLGRAGMLGGFLNKFDGGVEILDDLDDHWTAKNHKHERNWFIQELQELAAEKSIRVTILGGDVHLAAVGQFYSNPKLRIPKDRDHRYMANIISSAIVNKPPPNNMADILNRRNKTHHLDQDTDEDMIPMFTHDVDGSPRNNKRLLPRRNWCSIKEYNPGHTPPSTPPSSEPESDSDDVPAPPTRLRRTLSLTRGDVKPGNLLRRLSGRGLPSANQYPPGNRYDSGDLPSPDSPQNDGYFPRQSNQLQRAATVNNASGQRHSSAPISTGSVPPLRPGNFHRRPTNISEKAATRGDPNSTADHINLEHGLDIVLNCEVNQQDPAGVTVPYRLLIPALMYQGHGDENTAAFRKRSLVSRLTSIRGRRASTLAGAHGKGNYGQEESAASSDGEGEEPLSQLRPRRWSFGITQRRAYRDQTPPSEREIGEEGTQKGRQFEHRSQQIGQAAQQTYNAPPTYSGAHSEPETPTEEYEEARGDSVDYHQHLDSSPPEGGNGHPGRRLSKVDRMLGVKNSQHKPSTSWKPKFQRSNSVGAVQSTFAETKNADGASDAPYGDESEFEDYERPDQPRNEQRISQGYSGIEAYREKKGWRKWLDKAKEWEEKSR